MSLKPGGSQVTQMLIFHYSAQAVLCAINQNDMLHALAPSFVLCSTIKRFTSLFTFVLPASVRQLMLSSPPPPLLSSSIYLVWHRLLWALQVDLKHVEHFISVIGAFEDQIFQKRGRLLQRQKQRRERDKANKGHRHQPGQGQAGSKWKAAVPNASFTASLQPVGHHQSGLHHQ